MTPLFVIPVFPLVIPAEAGIQLLLKDSWTPAFAGVTGRGDGDIPCAC